MPRDRTIDDSPQQSFASSSLRAASVLLLVLAIFGLVAAVAIGASGSDAPAAVAAGGVAVASLLNAMLLWAFRSLCNSAEETARSTERMVSLLEGIRREMMSRGEVQVARPASEAPAIDLDRPVSRSRR